MFRQIKKRIESNFCVTVKLAACSKRRVVVNVIPDGAGYDLQAMRSAIIADFEASEYEAEFVSPNSWLLEVNK